MAITYTVAYEPDEEYIEIELEAEGQFYHGELEDFIVTPNVNLTREEMSEIEDRLCEEYANDWNEDAYKSRSYF